MVCRCWLWGFLCQEDASTLGHDSLPQSMWSPRHLFYLLGQLLLFFFCFLLSFLPQHILYQTCYQPTDFRLWPGLQVLVTQSRSITVDWFCSCLVATFITAYPLWRQEQPEGAMSHWSVWCRSSKKKTGLELQRHSSVCGWLWKLSTWHGPNGRRHEERDVSRRGNGRWWWVGK